MALEQAEQLLKAIDVADSPICFSGGSDLAIYRSEWEEELLGRSETVMGFKYWIDSESANFFAPLNTAEELLAVMTDKS